MHYDRYDAHLAFGDYGESHDDDLIENMRATTIPDYFRLSCPNA
jgi:hypothetical protein